MIPLKSSQKSQQKKLLSKMEGQIKQIHFQLNHKELIKIKNKIMKKIEINLCRGRLVAPFVIALGITYGGSRLFGATPFVLDEQRVNKKYMKEIDNNGNIHCEQQYEDFKEANDTLTYYGCWSKNQDGIYERNIKIYKMIDLSEIDILDIVNNSNISSYNDILGNPVSEKIELKNNITEEELHGKPYLFARYYYEDINDFIYVKQPEIINIRETFLWLFFTFYIEIAIALYRKVSSFYYYDEKEKIEFKYSDEYFNRLIKKLKILESNYNLLLSVKNKITLSKTNNNVYECDLFNYLNPETDMNILDLNGNEIQSIIILLNDFSLKLRDSLGVDLANTFGIEIEMERSKREKILGEFRKRYRQVFSQDGSSEYEPLGVFFDKKNLDNEREWCVKYDGSLVEGIEIATPILSDTLENWQELEGIYNLLNKYAKVGVNSSTHIHIGAQILGNDVNAWLNLMLIWSTYENVIFRFLYGEYLTRRPKIMKYSKVISSELWFIYNFLKDKDGLTVQEVIYYLKSDRHNALNFNNVNIYSCDKCLDKNTIESRGQNGTNKVEVVQNYVNFLIKLFEYCKSSNFDYNKIYKRHEYISNEHYTIEWYDEIFLEQALELCDMIFDNNLDKLYFLKQYLKEFKMNKHGYRNNDGFDLTKSEKNSNKLLLKK